MAPLAEPWRPLRGAAAHLWWSYYRAMKKREGVIAAIMTARCDLFRPHRATCRRCANPPLSARSKGYSLAKAGEAELMLDKTDDIAVAAEHWLASSRAALSDADEARWRGCSIPTATGATWWR